MKPDADPLRDPRFSELLSALRQLPAPEPPPDFSARVLQRVKTPPPRLGFAAAFGWRAAAAILILFCAIGLWSHKPATVLSSRSPSPVDILLSAQRSDGGWTADEQQLRPRYDVGVTALALLALLRAEADGDEGARAAAIRSGMAHLIRQQGADGRFGGDFSGAGFTHYLASMALQAAAKLPNADPAWIAANQRAASHLAPNVQMAKLNHHLAHPVEFPPRWAEAGGPTVQTALLVLRR